MNIPIKSIVSYIKQVYKPNDIDVMLKEKEDDSPDVYISILFDHIGDEYLKNPNASDKLANKEKHLERTIRKDIESFFSVKTSGLSLDGFAPYVHHKLTIDVIHSR